MSAWTHALAICVLYRLNKQFQKLLHIAAERGIILYTRAVPVKKVLSQEPQRLDIGLSPPKNPCISFNNYGQFFRSILQPDGSNMLAVWSDQSGTWKPSIQTTTAVLVAFRHSTNYHVGLMRNRHDLSFMEILTPQGNRVGMIEDVIGRGIIIDRQESVYCLRGRKYRAGLYEYSYRNGKFQLVNQFTMPTPFPKIWCVTVVALHPDRHVLYVLELNTVCHVYLQLPVTSSSVFRRCTFILAFVAV